MRATEFIIEYKLRYKSPAQELANKLIGYDDLSYAGIDKLMRKIAKVHDITPKKLHDLFVDEYDEIPDDWIKERRSMREDIIDNDNEQKVQKFIDWARNILKLKTKPRMIFSYDSDEATSGHHTGRYNPETGELWVYMGPKDSPRLLADVLRTVFHELTHVGQHERDEIEPGSSYPGSPIEREADVMAGKYIKIYGKNHPEIFK